jgi:hypothetical protein
MTPSLLGVNTLLSKAILLSVLHYNYSSVRISQLPYQFLTPSDINMFALLGNETFLCLPYC